MIETGYEYGSGYHEGSLVEQDALAFLGPYKRIEDVPTHYYLPGFASDFDARAAWESFLADDVSASESTVQYKYEPAYRHFADYCERHDANPALADPQDIEGYIANEMDIQANPETTYSTRYRPLYLWYRWMAFHADYPHRYQPTVMAILLDGACAECWATRFTDRTNNPLEAADNE